MASLSSPSRYVLAFLLLNLYLKVLDADSDTSLHFKNFGKGSRFESQLALYGDAKVENHSSSIQISSGNGGVVSKRPFKVVANSSQTASFSSYFVFSMSGKDGSSLAFVMFPLDIPLDAFDSSSMGLPVDGKRKFFAVQFDNFKDGKYGNDNTNEIEGHVSVNVRNVSSIHLKLNEGEKLQSWIDYEASSKRFEVRLRNSSDNNRPLNPLLTYPIDLSNFWEENEFIAGLSSSSGKSSHCNIYSWSFKSRTAPHWMHSQPMNPQHMSENGREIKTFPKRSDCALKIIVALIFGIGCGAMGAISVLFLWAVLGNKRPVVPEGIRGPKDEFECKKFDVVVVGKKTIEDGKK